MNNNFKTKEDNTANASMGIIFKGYASIFNLPDKDSDSVQYGAFKKSINKINAVNSKSKSASIKLLFEHSQEMPIGFINHIEEDEKGLYVEGEILSDSVENKKIIQMIQSGKVSGLSIGYIVRKSSVMNNIRLIKDAELIEVSVVTLPSNDMSRIIEVSQIKVNERNSNNDVYDNNISESGDNKVNNDIKNNENLKSTQQSSSAESTDRNLLVRDKYDDKQHNSSGNQFINRKATIDQEVNREAKKKVDDIDQKVVESGSSISVQQRVEMINKYIDGLENNLKDTYNSATQEVNAVTKVLKDDATKEDILKYVQDLCLKCKDTIEISRRLINVINNIIL